MRILVAIDQMGGGGAARVTGVMVNGLVERGHKVAMASNWSKGSHYTLPPDISRYEIRSIKTGKTPIASIVMHCRGIRQALAAIEQWKPDVVIGVQTTAYLWMRFATWLKRIPCVAVDHTSFGRKTDRFTKFMRLHFYGTADALSILTHKDERLLGRKFPRKVVIYNPLSFPILNHHTTRRNVVVAAGRVYQWDIKGFDLLIQAWAKIAYRHLDWNLEIAGSGSEQDFRFLSDIALRNGVSKSVKFVGEVMDMSDYLSHASIFALSSRVEGMPMVLIEAMSQGCCCVSFDVQGAVSEMMTHDKGGLIAPDGDIEKFSDLLETAIESEGLRKTLGEYAMEEAKKFDVNQFIDNWESLLNKVLKTNLH